MAQAAAERTRADLSPLLSSLTKSEFKLLVALTSGAVHSQRQAAAESGLSLGSVNRLCREFSDRGLVDGFTLTDAGRAALEPYRVENAVIMAAGISSRFAPLSFERPKGLFEVRGEVLIERQIRQLQEAGITDITVVVGYMKEAFFYLADSLGVRIVVNPDYATRNNNGTLMLVREQLGNTYVCSSDNYFTENPFTPYAYEAFYSGVYIEGPTDEYCVRTARDGRIVDVHAGDRDAWALLGHAYFDRAFSREFVRILEAEFDSPATAPKLWEDIYADHLRELRMVLCPSVPGTVFEFDRLSDLCAFDRDFMVNVDSRILDNICATLGCEREDIVDVRPVKQGLTNLSVLFRCKGVQYVYRHPGTGTDEIVNRHAELHALKVAQRLGIDGTFVYEDPDEGWKLSRYLPDCMPFDYRDRAQVAGALRLIRRLHESGETSPWSFDFHDEARRIVDLLRKRSFPLPPDFAELQQRMDEIATFVRAEACHPCLCHNDFYGPNILVQGSDLHLIDWEYAAMGDYGCDLGNFICQEAAYAQWELPDVLALYFGRAPTEPEARHCTACTALVAFYWYVWALYKEAQGNAMGVWLYRWYCAAKEYAACVLPWYRAGEEPDWMQRKEGAPC